MTSNDLVTKKYLRSYMDKKLDSFGNKLKKELRGEMMIMRVDLRKEMATLRTDVRTELTEHKKDVLGEMLTIKEEIMTELKIMRENQDAHNFAHMRINDDIVDLNKRVGVLE